ncbi:serine/threonine-protein kinase [Nocardioides sp. SLBN-35]|uniref:serine/threonine-protein kinase n=1 Tax=Nocardioides sp. SLBN-35 TaxID=2768445 RepID=UPI00114F08EA|nr:serine/threonine-protein kinase [Nocardioides sp. SLBN-35]TQK73264.1 serine/threonine protein kinase [Nocardioides sp. SLBN-35]
MGGSEPRAGDWLGRYQLVEVLGRGGMGTVWRAHDPQLERDVALKVINPALGQDAEFRERFRREAVVLSRMDSAHVVAVFDHGEQDGAPYLVTQLVRGGDLSAVLRTRGAVEPSYAVDLACQVLEGLADAHAIGVVHRDVKPSNVLLRDDGSTAYLCDFGIATSPGGELTRTGVLVGSAAYMAPERHSGDTGAAGVAGDVYSAGCLLWTMLTGTPPYVGTDAEVAMGHLRGPVPQVPGRDPFLDGLNAVLRRSLAKDPRRRYPSARAMLADLSALRTSAPEGLVLPEVTSVRQPLDTSPAPGSLRRRLVATTLVLALVGLAVYVGSLLGGVDMTPSVLTAEDPSTGATTPATATPDTTPTPNAPSSTPRPKKERSATPELVDPGPVAEEPTSPAKPTKKAKPKPTPSPIPTPAPAQPVPTFRCWTGAQVVASSGCALPTGWKGAQWVFPGVESAPACKPWTLKASGYVEGWHCGAKTPDGTYRHLTVTRWTSASAATSYYYGAYNPDRSRVNQPWAGRDIVYGKRLGGFIGRSVYHSDRVYTHSGTNAWAFSAWANTSAKVQSMFDYVKFRNPTQFRGVPLR